HAEVLAIREACKKLDSFNLEGCEIYTSCEPCPMCLGAIYWAHINKVYFAGTREDAAEINFDDQFIYDEIGKTPNDRKIQFLQIGREEAIKVFDKWKVKEDKTEY
ncbi:MAG: nucleoside deaminase, partial [Prolixibacteraceae bacterium]|nr:nucleoside deaminase [Prolixibacteraceae bacterium]